MIEHHRQSWPRPLRDSHETACHFCDTIYKVELIKEGERADCSTCGQVLYHNRPKSIQRAAAYAITGVLLFILFMVFPFINLTTPASETIMSVPQAVGQIWDSGGGLTAFAVSLFVIILPILQLLLLLYICIPLLFGKTLPAVVQLTRLLHAIEPWVMLEVFFMGIIVSLLKLTKLAEVEMLAGFWSLLALMLCVIAALSSIDKLELWDRIESSREKTKPTTPK